MGHPCAPGAHPKKMLEKLVAAHAASKLKFFGTHAALADAVRFAEFLGRLRPESGSREP